MSTAAPAQSRVLAALAAMSLTELADARAAVVDANNPPAIHPFFTAPTAPAVKPRATAPPLKSATSLPATKKSSLVRVSRPKTAEPTPAVEKAAPEPPATLPVYSYKSLSPTPKMRFTRDEAEADKWVQRLDQTGPISVDFEWVVVYRKGGVRPVSLVQLADPKSILVIQLRTSTATMPRFPLALQRLLEDPTVPKMGANILTDAKKLFKDYGVMMAGLVELGSLARLADPASTEVFGRGKRIVALAKLVERYLHKKLRKDGDVRVSNWEDPALERNEVQIEYAANDAYCALQVYEHLLALAKASDITLDPMGNATRVHHASLAPPPTAPHLPTSTSSSTSTSASASPPTGAPVDPPSLPPVPMLVLTPAMEAAGVSPQHLRAYRHWALGHRDIDTMCAELALRPRGAPHGTVATPLTRGTVVSYIISAVKNWPALAYDLGALRLLIQTDLRSWQRHYEWIATVGSVDAPA
ncbi:ribonuclease H-like domain-containing protein [Mycena capillaripes]|nr:ribonuclease H-like domain-containing protein [Mycena capillaripes]